jgi:predicted AlkP superfamily pyrophosphatase or phosphodiesterase
LAGLGALAQDAPLRKKVLLLGIDGCRTDALLAAETPHLDSLIKEGAFSDQTRIFQKEDTAADTVSGPGWSNILTGVWPEKHGVLDNRFEGHKLDQFPCFFRRLKDARPGAVCVSLENWGQIDRYIISAADKHEMLRDPDSKDYAQADERVARRACEVLAEMDPDAMFVYLGNVDETGHKTGFHPTVKEYIAAIETVDGHVGEILAALRARKTYAQEDWLVLVGTDHGGRGTDHGKLHAYPEVNTVFLIVSGRSAARGKIEGPTSQVDLVATALAHLGVGVDPKWDLDGKPAGLRAR